MPCVSGPAVAPACPVYASVACQLFWACNMCWPCRAAVLAFVTPLLPRLRYLPVSVSVLRGAPVKIVYHLILSEEIQVRSHVCYLCRRDPCCSMHALSGTLAVHRSVDMRGLHSWACTSRCGGAYQKIKDVYLLVDVWMREKREWMRERS